MRSRKNLEKQNITPKVARHYTYYSGIIGRINRKIFLVNYFSALFFILILSSGTVQSANAASVRVGFDVTAEPDIASYRIFYGTQSSNYTDSITVTSPQATYVEESVDGLVQGRRYYFAVKAIDLAGQESDASDEANITIPYSFPAGDLTAHFNNIEWLETGTVEVGSEWTTVSLSRNFDNPVVLVSPVSARDGAPCIVRVANVTAQSFALRIQEWDYLDGEHQVENLSYIVIEEGVYQMPDGTIWQAGTYEVSGNRNFTQVAFPAAFNSVPLVFQTVQTENETDAVAVREKDITVTGFAAAMEEQESLSDGHGVETVGYLAVEKNVEGDHVIGEEIATHELFIPSGIEDVYLKLEEEQSRDEETVHTRENIGYMQIGDLFLAQIQTYNGPDTCTMRFVTAGRGTIDENWFESQDWIEVGSVTIDHNWKTVVLKRNFANPVVILGPPTRNGGDPSVMRVRNVTSDSFEMRLQEWNYNNGPHVTETVSYMVVEAGVHELPDGTIWEAGLYEQEGTEAWKSVSLNAGFAFTPVVLQTVQTVNGDQAVTTRLKSIGSTGFLSAFEEEEKLNDGHVAETVGFLALPLTSPCKTGIVSINHKMTPAGDNLPSLMIEEEKSRDRETWHVHENVGYLGLGTHFFGHIQTYHGGDTAVLRRN